MKPWRTFPLEGWSERFTSSVSWKTHLISMNGWLSLTRFRRVVASHADSGRLRIEQRCIRLLE